MANGLTMGMYNIIRKSLEEANRDNNIKVVVLRGTIFFSRNK
jgi:hypothetical protein